jgi:7-cyano-7-deazaguanine reductase
MTRKISGLRQLGSEVPVPNSPEEAELERVPNPHADTAYVARFTAPEFTCLCPVTGQPDFAHFVVDYAPRGFLLESKSFKLFLASFRNTAAFHEDATITIGKRIVDLVEPAWLRIGGYWYPRGGILSTCSGSKGRRPKACASPIKAWRLIAGGGDRHDRSRHHQRRCRWQGASPHSAGRRGLALARRAAWSRQLKARLLDQLGWPRSPWSPGSKRRPSNTPTKTLRRPISRAG